LLNSVYLDAVASIASKYGESTWVLTSLFIAGYPWSIMNLMVVSHTMWLQTFGGVRVNYPNLKIFIRSTYEAVPTVYTQGH